MTAKKAANEKEIKASEKAQKEAPEKSAAKGSPSGDEGQAAPSGEAVQPERAEGGIEGAFGATIPAASAGEQGTAAPAVVTKPQAPVATRRASVEASEELVERVTEAVQSLQDFGGISLPRIGFKDDFKLREDEEPVEEFTGVILHTKESNVYYANRYKAGSREQPTCYSPDGKKPVTENPQAPTCAACPFNKFGSAKEGEGKACKNTRQVFIVLKNSEGEFAVIPKVLRIPPTSLTNVRNFMVGCAADFGSYYNVVTKFHVYKKSDDQTHHNIGFGIASRLAAQEKADIQFIRQGWMDVMTHGNFGVDEEEIIETTTRPVAAAEQTETRF